MALFSKKAAKTNNKIKLYFNQSLRIETTKYQDTKYQVVLAPVINYTSTSLNQFLKSRCYAEYRNTVHLLGNYYSTCRTIVILDSIVAMYRLEYKVDKD